MWLPNNMDLFKKEYLNGKSDDELADMFEDGSPDKVRKVLFMLRQKESLPTRIQLVKEQTDTTTELNEDVALRFLKERGYVLNKNDCQTDLTIEIIPKLIRGETYRLGIVSDTHAGSKYALRSCLVSAYEYFKEQRIEDVVHTGDLCDGEKMYKGHEYELHKHGADSQMQYVLDIYPKVPGVTTHIIAGNHDASFLKNSGINVVEHISKQRDDFNYCGIQGAELLFGSLSFMLLHPKGGGSYSRSYRLQKICEQFPPERKPHVALFGHWHSNCLLTQYRNIFAAMIGCCQSQTPFERTLGLYPECGWGVLEFRSDMTGAVSYKYEWIPWYEIKPNDY